MTKIQIKHTKKIKTQGKQTNNIFNMYHRKKSIAEYEKTYKTIYWKHTYIIEHVRYTKKAAI